MNIKAEKIFATLSVDLSFQHQHAHQHAHQHGLIDLENNLLKRNVTSALISTNYLDIDLLSAFDWKQTRATITNHVTSSLVVELSASKVCLHINIFTIFISEQAELHTNAFVVVGAVNSFSMKQYPTIFPPRIVKNILSARHRA